ncbi:hypothetical protein D3C86_1836050 [compost metagenome]
MADEHHADARRFQFVDHPQQAVDLLPRQRSGWLIHDHQPCVGGNGTAYGHQLAIGNRQFFDFLVGIDMHANARHGIQRRLAHHLLAHPEMAAGQVAVNGDIFRHGQIGE